MASTSTDDQRELEKLIAATKESYRSRANINTAGVAANVVEDRRKVLDAVVKAGDQLKAYPAVVDTPYLIWARPIGILVDSQIEPGNSWAKIEGSHNHGGIGGFGSFYDTVSFHYFWDNPSPQYYALVNVASTLVTKGFVVATGNSGYFESGDVTLNATTTLFLYQWPDEPRLTYQASQQESMYSAEAHGHVFGPPVVDTTGVFYEAGVEYTLFPIPPGRRAVFAVGLALKSGMRGSCSTSFDFAGDDNYVQCPSLVLTILYDKHPHPPPL